jgi:hypothetical protein
MNALRLRTTAKTLIRPLQRQQLRNKAVFVGKSKPPQAQVVEKTSYTTYGAVVVGVCGIAAGLDYMGYSHHDLLGTEPKNTMKRRDTLLDGVRGSNWH